jgi:hypothetical protein
MTPASTSYFRRSCCADFNAPSASVHDLRIYYDADVNKSTLVTRSVTVFRGSVSYILVMSGNYLFITIPSHSRSFIPIPIPAPICIPRLFPSIIQRLFPFPPTPIPVHQLRNSNVM